MVVPVERQFPSVRLKVGGVLHRCGCSEHARQLHTRCEHALGLAVVPVEYHVESIVEESEVDTEVECRHLLPCERIAHELRLLEGCHLLVAYHPVGTNRFHTWYVSVSRDVLVADVTPRHAQLEVRNHLAAPLHEVLLADAPSCRYRGEESEAVLLGELRGSVVASVVLEKILALVGIGETIEQTAHRVAAVVVACIVGTCGLRQRGQFLVDHVGAVGCVVSVVVALLVEACHDGEVVVGYAARVVGVEVDGVIVGIVLSVCELRIRHRLLLAELVAVCIFKLLVEECFLACLVVERVLAYYLQVLDRLKRNLAEYTGVVLDVVALSCQCYEVARSVDRQHFAIDVHIACGEIRGECHGCAPYSVRCIGVRHSRIGACILHVELGCEP